MYASQRIQVFPFNCRPETHFRYTQGHQGAGALTGTINIVQNTIFTVYEVESQKTVYRKLSELTNWFPEIIKEIFHHSFRES